MRLPVLAGGPEYRFDADGMSSSMDPGRAVVAGYPECSRPPSVALRAAGRWRICARAAEPVRQEDAVGPYVVTWMLAEPGSDRQVKLYFAGLSEGIDMSPNAAAAVCVDAEEARAIMRQVADLGIEGLTDLRMEQAPPLQSAAAARLGHSVAAMLREAHRNGLSQTDDDLPCLQGAVEPFEAAQADIRRTVATHHSGDLDRLVRLACEYLWGKSIEAALLWARSDDGEIEVGFSMEDLLSGSIHLALPDELIGEVMECMDAMEPYYEAFQMAILEHQEELSPEEMGAEVSATLQHLPLVGMAYAINLGMHEREW